MILQFKRNRSAGTAAKKCSKSSLLARLLLLLAILLLVAVSCQNKKPSDKKPSEVPTWVKQNIDTSDACKIILSDNIKLIKVGNSYTASYTFSDTHDVWYKVDKSVNSVDFAFSNWGIQYFSDSCQLKESLRSFMKLQMVKYIGDHF